MDSKQKRDAYSACDIYVCSSIRESLGTSVLEAMAQGKPVIGTNAGGLPEVVPDKSCLYRLGNRDELRKKITVLLENKKLSSKIGRKGHKKAQQFRFEEMRGIYLKALGDLPGQ